MIAVDDEPVEVSGTCDLPVRRRWLQTMPDPGDHCRLLTQVFGAEVHGVRLVVIVLIAIFPVITNTLFGLQSADQLHHDLFTLNKASQLDPAAGSSSFPARCRRS
jgi:hypothetical protein